VYKTTPNKKKERLYICPNTISEETKEDTNEETNEDTNEDIDKNTNEDI